MNKKLTAIVGCAAEGIFGSVERAAQRLGCEMLTSQTPEKFWKRGSLGSPFCAIVEAHWMIAASAAGTKFGEVPIPCIAIVKHGDVPAAVHAMHTGALNVLEEPLDDGELLSNLQSAQRLQRWVQRRTAELRRDRRRLESLTPREKVVLDFLMSGKRNKQIAKLLKVSLRTVEADRARIMQQAGVESLPSLVGFVLNARRRVGENPWQLYGSRWLTGSGGLHGVSTAGNY